MLNRIIAIFSLMFIFAACDKGGSTPHGEEGEHHEHAPEGAAPGSHEDWCGEHSVPESMCTRCNPSLIPAFKATGDWCDEHEVPKSQCLACDPNLVIERPPREGS